MIASDSGGSGMACPTNLRCTPPRSTPNTEGGALHAESPGQTTNTKRRKHRLVTVLIFVCTFVAYWERLGFSIAFTDVATNMGISETEKGSIFAAFYYGYSFTPIFGGFLAKTYGGKSVLALAFLLWVPASSLTAVPAGSVQHVLVGVVACRVVIGLAQGMFLPAAHTVLGHWIPSKHRGRHFAFAMSGMYAGAATAMLSAPTLITAYGPASIFHIAGALGASWLLLWLLLGSSSPATTFRIAPGLERETARRMQTTNLPSVESPTTGSHPSTSGTKGHARHRSDCSDMEVEEEEESRTDAWKDFGIPAPSSDWFSFSNFALYEQCSWEADQLSKFPSSSSLCSPTPSPVTGPSFPRSITSLYPQESEKTTVVWNGHHLGRHSRVPLGAPSGRSRMAYGDCHSGSSGGGGGGGSRHGGTRADRSISGGTSRRGENSKGNGSDPDGRTQSSSTSTAPATPNSIRSSSIDAQHRLSGHFVTVQRLQSLLSSAQGLRHPGFRSSDGGGVSDCGSTGSGGTRAQGGGAGSSNNGVTEDRNRCGGSATTIMASCNDDSLEGGCSGNRRVGPRGRRAAGVAPAVYAAAATTDAVGGPNVDALPPARREERADSRHLPGDCRRLPSSLMVGVSSGCASDGGCSRDRNCSSDNDNDNDNDAGAGGKSGGDEASTGSSSMPWKAMFCSRAAWAVVVGNVGCSTGVSVMMSWQPTYFREFLGINLEELGVFDQLSPYLTMLVFSILGGVWYSWLVNKRGVSKSTASKLITGVGLSSALVAFFTMALATTAATGTLTTSAALAALAVSRGGWSTNHAEICAPEHGSMLFSVANCVSSITSVVGITVTGWLLDAFGGAEDVSAWTAAMGMVGGLCGVCGVYYVVAAGGDQVLFPGSFSGSLSEGIGGGGVIAGSASGSGGGETEDREGRRGSGGGVQQQEVSRFEKDPGCSRSAPLCHSTCRGRQICVDLV